MIMSDKEKWRATHDSFYEVSNLGRVRSYKQHGRWGKRVLTPHILKHVYPGIKGRGGYASVQFGKGRMQFVHRLVAVAFLGPVPEGMEVMHRDDDPANPCLSNLEYGTRSQNLQDMVERGRARPLRGEAHPKARLTTSQVLEIRLQIANIPRVGRIQRLPRGVLRQIADQYGVAQITIEHIKLGLGWAHV